MTKSERSRPPQRYRPRTRVGPAHRVCVDALKKDTSQQEEMSSGLNLNTLLGSFVSLLNLDYSYTQLQQIEARFCWSFGPNSGLKSES